MKNILIFLALILFSQLLPKTFFLENREYQFVEIMQTIILFSCLFIHFQYRKFFLRVSNLFTYLLRKFLFLLLIYEELSFLSTNSNNYFNIQQEFNFHNSYFFTSKLFSIVIPNSNISFTLNLDALIYALALFFLGYGSFFPTFRNIRYLFLERQFSIYTFLFILNIIVTSVLIDFKILNNEYLIHNEILELFIYLLLLLDTLYKRKNMASKL